MIWTFELNYPRFIHAELMTHRVFSRNAASSRAIPIEKLIAQVRENPAMPVHWGANQKGMQAAGEVDDIENAKLWWRNAANTAADQAEFLAHIGLHKQVVNRVLEPFVWMRTIVTTTDLENWFELRNHKDAQPEIKRLAECMWQIVIDAVPQDLAPDQWHLPYLLEAEQGDKRSGSLCRISAARCARVSYLTHEGREPNEDADIALFNRLVGSKPLHASPLEHQAQPGRDKAFWGNFHGWEQYRKFYEIWLAGKEVDLSVIDFEKIKLSWSS